MPDRSQTPDHQTQTPLVVALPSEASDIHACASTQAPEMKAEQPSPEGLDLFVKPDRLPKFSIEPTAETRQWAKDGAQVVHDFMEQRDSNAQGPESPFKKFVETEALFHAINAHVNAALEQVRVGALREILQSVHDHVDPTVVGLQIGKRLWNQDGGEIRTIADIRFMAKVPKELLEEVGEPIETFEADEMDFPAGNNPCDAIETVSALMLEEISPRKPLQIWLDGYKPTEDNHA